jgi:hypothetical protein
MENTPVNQAGAREEKEVSKGVVVKQETINKKEKAKDTAIKALAIVGLAGILALVSYGVVKYAPKGIKSLASGAVSLSSKFFPGGDKLTLKADKYNLESGEDFTLTWKNPKKDEGTYTVKYGCKDGVRLETFEEGTETGVLLCDEEYRFLDSENSITLAAYSDEEAYAEVPITLTFTKLGDEEATESAEITIQVKNEELEEEATPTPSPTPTPTPAPTKVPTPTPYYYVPPRAPAPVITTVPAAENPNGKPDLDITILATGVVNKRTEVFTEKSEIKDNEKAAVRFEVKNIGDKQSGAWRFESKLPTKASYTFKSASQVSLMPGDKIEYVLGFDEFKNTDSLRFTIEVDPSDAVDESDETNNEATVNIDVER